LSYTATASRKSTRPLSDSGRLLREYLLDLGMLFLSALVAVHLRRVLPFGQAPDAYYRWYDPVGYLAIALGLSLAYAWRLFLPHGARPELGARRFWSPLIGIGLASLLLIVVVPLSSWQYSRLQTTYFAAVALFLSLLIVPWPRANASMAGVPPLRDSIARLWANRGLLHLWVRYNVRSRYAQALLGILWIALLPLSTALIMALVFAEIMRVPTGGVPFISFLLAGLVPWGLFSQSVSVGARLILNEMGLIKQVYFPREIIVLSALGEALVDAAFMFGAMLLVNAAVGVWPNALYAALPLLIVIQLALSLGLMLMIGWLSVLVRDIPQLVGVLLQLALYLSPIIYPLSIVPERYRFLFALNPIATLIEAYRSIIVYDRAPDWLSLLYPGALALGVLVFGYRLFKANEDRFADLA